MIETPCFLLLPPTTLLSFTNLRAVLMFSSTLLTSSSTGLESLLLCSPGSPRFSIAGRLSYSTAPPHSFFLSPTTSPQPESDIGLQSPGSLAHLSNAKVTYSDLIASSKGLQWSSTPKLGAGPLVANTSRKSSNGHGVTSSPRRRFAARKNPFDGRYASISQVLSSPCQSNAFEGAEICPIDLFAGAGLGLGLAVPLPLANVPRSTDEFTIIPITEVAPGSLSRSRAPPTQLPASPVYSPSSVYTPDSLASLSPIPEPPRRSPVFNATLNAAVSESPAASPAHTQYEDLGHGLPSHMRGSGSRLRLPSTTEAEHETQAASTRLPQHVGLGLGLPSALRSAMQPQASPEPPSSPKSPAPTPLKSRLQSTVHELFSTRKFAKRPLFTIPEARSREASAEGRATMPVIEVKAEENGKGKTKAGQQQQKSGQGSGRPHMSPAMRLAAESILQEDRKFRKKEGLKGEVPMSPTMRLVQEEGRKFRKQEGAEKKSKFKFLF
ncbi:hypothetical protein FB451DRAFT_1550426 [Mycena latifolia]|nr:hypothetical protein FB451DRAFT_1550426 [Mycena latifolia]